jgi:plastocyanin
LRGKTANPACFWGTVVFAVRRLGLALAVSSLLACPAAAGAQLAPPTTIAPPPEHQADPSLTTHVFRVGPYQLGGYQTLRRTETVAPPPVRGSIVGMDVRVVDPQGQVIPQDVLMLHHNVFTNGGPDNSRVDGACPQRLVRERFYGTSEELRPLTLPRGYGYPTAPEDRWKMIWMVMNHRHEPRSAYLEYRVTVDPSPGITPVKPYWLSVVPCVSDPQYTVPGGRPPGREHRLSRTFTLPESGRIVAVGGHLHGGSKALVLSQPGCGHRSLAVNEPTYAPAGDPLYRVSPLLHEPDPKSISWHQWSDGWGIRQGEQLKVTAVYDGSRPHMRVMGIAHVYVAPDATVPASCAPPPASGVTLGPGFAGRSEPPNVRLTLAELRSDGRAHPIKRPRGSFRRLSGDVEVAVRRFGFHPPLLSIPRGASVSWIFSGRRIHDATLVSGPRGFATATVRGGVVQRVRFKVPGEYRLYCSIHPVTMAQLVTVRASRRR